MPDYTFFPSPPYLNEKKTFLYIENYFKVKAEASEINVALSDALKPYSKWLKHKMQTLGPKAEKIDVLLRILPALRYTMALDKATTQADKDDNYQKLKKAIEQLKPHPNWSNRMRGAKYILSALLLTSLFLLSAWFYWVVVIPTTIPALILTKAVSVFMGVLGPLLGGFWLLEGIDIFRDTCRERGALVKALDKFKDQYKPKASDEANEVDEADPTNRMVANGL
ncbi:MAG: hypothetical protein QNK11_01210 [Legionella sp.]|nr:hypothetical protein [Legionella sp.]